MKYALWPKTPKGGTTSCWEGCILCVVCVRLPAPTWPPPWLAALDGCRSTPRLAHAGGGGGEQIVSVGVLSRLFRVRGTAEGGGELRRCCS